MTAILIAILVPLTLGVCLTVLSGPLANQVQHMRRQLGLPPVTFRVTRRRLLISLWIIVPIGIAVSYLALTSQPNG